MKIRRMFCNFLLIVLLMTELTVVIGQEFAIQNKVMIGKDVASETRTILTHDAYYDVMLDDGQPTKVSVFYPTKHKFQLVNFTDDQQTTIGELDVREFVAKQELRAKGLSSLVKFAADPTFRESRDGDILRLENPIWEYQVLVDDKQNPEIVDAYHKFADAFARLNAFWSLPPNARLKLNEAIHRHQAIPQRVDVHIKETFDSPKIEQHTMHSYTWVLTASDKQIIQLTEKGIREFSTVNVAEFLNATLGADSRTKKRR